MCTRVRLASGFSPKIREDSRSVVIFGVADVYVLIVGVSGLEKPPQDKDYDQCAYWTHPWSFFYSSSELPGVTSPCCPIAFLSEEQQMYPSHTPQRSIGGHEHRVPTFPLDYFKACQPHWAGENGKRLETDSRAVETIAFPGERYPLASLAPAHRSSPRTPITVSDGEFFTPKSLISRRLHHPRSTVRRREGSHTRRTGNGHVLR